MQPPASFKLALLGHMLAGFRGVSSRSMGILERKAAFKHAADMAMATARGGGAKWSRALLADLSKNKAAAEPHSWLQLRRPPRAPCGASSSSKKILRRSFRARSRAWKRPPAPRRAASASLLARRMVKKRAQVLRRLVPGGDAMDGFSLLEETLDYVVSLRAQVELMRRLTGALDLAHQR